MQLAKDWLASAWARRPAGLVDQTRWLFCWTVLLSLLLTLPAPLSAGDGAAVALIAVLSALVLAASWVLTYQQRGPALVLAVAQVLATLAFAAACPEPSAAFAFTFSAIWLRALYGSTARNVLYCAALAGAMAASLLMWPLVPGHEGAANTGPVLASLPALFLTFVVARHLGLALFAREQSRDRDAVLVELSAHLLGITDRDRIWALAWQAAQSVCAASPGLRAAVVRAESDHDQLQVVRTAGSFVAVPEVLPRAVLLDGAARTGVWPVHDPASLNDAVGVADGSWVSLALPERPGFTMLLGAPGGVDPDALVAVQSMMNQVALALRACEAHQDLTLQAHTDSLTGLKNRAAFTQALDAALAAHSLPTLLFVDLDDFKTVNDRLGHAAGDELLRHVANRLRRAVRPQDVCARLGGDEFAVLLPAATPEVAQDVAQRLVELIAEPVLLRQGGARVGASVGVAAAKVSVTAEQLMQRADAAMYAAKAQGKNRVQAFDPCLLQPDRQQPADPGQAGAGDTEPLVVHDQPIVWA